MIVTRLEIADMLRRWQAGEVSAREVHAWAEDRYARMPEVDVDDWEGLHGAEESVANEVLGELDRLNMNLVLAEDVPIYLEFLATPPGSFRDGQTAVQRGP